MGREAVGRFTGAILLSSRNSSLFHRRSRVLPTDAAEPTLSGITASQNEADYGSFEASDPFSLQVSIPDLASGQASGVQLLVQTSGQVLHPPVAVLVKDIMNSTATTFDWAITAHPFSDLAGGLTVLAANGIASFGALNVKAPPNTTFYMYFTATSDTCAFSAFFASDRCLAL